MCAATYNLVAEPLRNTGKYTMARPPQLPHEAEARPYRRRAIISSPAVVSGPLATFPPTNPTIVSLPLAVIAGILGTLTSMGRAFCFSVP